jgi:hypothetical protein
VRLKVGDIEVEARTVEEADHLLQRVQTLQASQGSPNDGLAYQERLRSEWDGREADRPRSPPEPAGGDDA